MTPRGRPLAYLLMREMLSMDPKVQRRRWELKLGLDLLRSITAKGVIIPLSSQLGFRGFRICSSKIALGWRFAVSGVFLRFLNTRERHKTVFVKMSKCLVGFLLCMVWGFQNCF